MVLQDPRLRRRLWQTPNQMLLYDIAGLDLSARCGSTPRAISACWSARRWAA